jgi:hypothetical protein
MKNIVILALFVLTSVTAFAQTEAELTEQGAKGRQILLDNGIPTHCFTATMTVDGLLIGTRDNSNVPVNYLYTSTNQLNQMDNLNGYVVLDALKDILLVGKYTPNRRGITSMCNAVYTYNLTTKKFVLQDEGWIYGSTKFVGKDSINIESTANKRIRVTKAIKLK